MNDELVFCLDDLIKDQTYRVVFFAALTAKWVAYLKRSNIPPVLCISKDKEPARWIAYTVVPVTQEEGYDPITCTQWFFQEGSIDEDDTYYNDDVLWIPLDELGITIDEGSLISKVQWDKSLIFSPESGLRRSKEDMYWHFAVPGADWWKHQRLKELEVTHGV